MERTEHIRSSPGLGLPMQLDIPNIGIPPVVDVMSILHPHQVEMLDRLRMSLRAGHRRIMAQAPTGSGKTICAACIIQEARRKGRRVVMTVPFIDLVGQTVDKLVGFGITEIGVMQADHPLTDRTQPIQICSIDTLSRRTLPETDLVIVDEAHLSRKFLETWMGDPKWADVPFIGLSATPGTKGLGKHYTDLCSTVTTQDLIDRGFLSPFRVFAPGAPDLSKVRIVAGEYDDGELAAAMSPLTADIVNTWLARGNNEPTLVFAVNRLHAQELQAAFVAAGIPTGYRDAFTAPNERKRQAHQFHTGELKVITNVGTLTTGTDWDVRCLVLARPTRSKMTFVQIIGRALRTAPGKAFATILDHTSTTQRLGFVTDITFALDKGERVKPKQAKERETPFPRQCPQCKCLRPVKINVCPACGFEARPKSKIACDAGELIEVTKPVTVGVSDKETRQRWWSMLNWIQADRGYKSGWRWHQFVKRFGVNPTGLDGRSMLRPDGAVTNYLKHQAIRHSHSHRGRAA